jgi:hypothetical protein
MLYTGSNNGEIGLSVRQAARLLHCSVTFARRMFAELEGKGFVRPNQRGAFKWKARHSTTWILTLHEYQGRPGSKEFMQWKPPEKQNSVPPRDTDGATPWHRGTVETASTVLRHGTEKPDSDPLSCHHVIHSIVIPPTSSSQIEPDFESANAAAGAPCVAWGGTMPRSRQQKATWLFKQLEAGHVTGEALANAFGLDPEDPRTADAFIAIFEGKRDITRTQWQRCLSAVGAPTSRTLQ